MSALKTGLATAGMLALVLSLAFGPYVLAFLIGVVVGRMG